MDAIRVPLFKESAAYVSEVQDCALGSAVPLGTKQLRYDPGPDYV
jgi:hypothetical protein